MISVGRLTPDGVLVRADAKNTVASLCSACYGGRRRTILIPWSQTLKCERIGRPWEITYVDTSVSPHCLRKCQFMARSDGEETLLHSNGHDEELPSSFFEPAPPKRLLMFLNPAAGAGRGRKHFQKIAKPIFEAAGTIFEVVETSYGNQANEYVQTINLDDWDGIVCIAGDGMPHEVLNGLARRPDASQALAKIGIAQLPGGSGNAMTHSLNGGSCDWALATLNIIRGTAQPVDLMAVSQGNSTFYSFLSTSFGIVADCDLGTQDWRWMGGARFTVGIVLKSLSQRSYPCEIAYKTAQKDDATRTPTLETRFGSVRDSVPDDWTVEQHPNMSMFYVGKMPWMSADALVFPCALPTDGAMDMLLWDTDIGRIKALYTLSQFEKGSHVDSCEYKKVVAFRLIPKTTRNYLSIDGEQYPCEPLQVEILPRVGRFFVVPDA